MFLLQKEDTKDWQTGTELLPFLKAPVKKGEKVGEVIYMINGEEIGRAALTAAQDVDRAGLGRMLERMLILWI